VRKKHNDKEISEEQMFGIDEEIQKITDATMIPIDEMGRRKEAELLQIYFYVKKNKSWDYRRW
jgi:ribosome recycling factor